MGDRSKDLRNAKYGVTIANDDGGVKRKMTLVRFAEDGGYGVILETDWCDGTPPVRTKFLLGQVGFTMLTELMSLAHDLHRYKITDEADGPNDLE